MFNSVKVSLLAFAIFLTGCISMQADVTAFHSMPPNPKQLNYSFYLLPGQDNLKHSTFMNNVRAELSKYNFNETSFTESDVVITFNYSISDGAQQLVSVPTFGQTGVKSSNTTGTVNTYGNSANVSATTTYQPTYGVTGTTTRTQTVFTRRLKLMMFDSKTAESTKPVAIYEADVSSTGTTGQLAGMVPYMIKALFKQFPGKSGVMRRETITIETSQSSSSKSRPVPGSAIKKKKAN